MIPYFSYIFWSILVIVRRSPGPITNNWGGRRPTLSGGVGVRQPPHVNGGVWGGAGAPPQNTIYKNHICLFLGLLVFLNDGFRYVLLQAVLNKITP